MNRGGIVSHISNELQINHFYNVFYKIDQLNFLFLVSFPSAVSFEFIEGDQKFLMSSILFSIDRLADEFVAALVGSCSMA